MHKRTHRSGVEEYLDGSHSCSFKSKRRTGRERGNADKQKSTTQNSQWVYGNLFECLSGNENCTHGRLPFGGSFYCAWPLKNSSADFHHKPPCVWDAERE